MPKIIDYVVVTRVDVMNMINKGYVPIGGAFLNAHKDLVQTLIKYEIACCEECGCPLSKEEIEGGNTCCYDCFYKD
jgi:hypothetical protein